MNISKTDCRTDDGVVVGLIDGIIAMSRVVAKSDLSSPEIQEALKDLQSDEDVKKILVALSEEHNFTIHIDE